MRLHRGDTIIELMIAFAIFSAAAITTIVILNKGSAITRRSLETSIVRQQIDSQGEIIRYIHDSGDDEWSDIVKADNLTATANLRPISDNNTVCYNPASNPADKAFFVYYDRSSNKFVRANVQSGQFAAVPDIYASVNYDSGSIGSEGIWVQATEAENRSASVKAYDFYIHACWNSVGSEVPVTLGSIVRIYDSKE